MGDTAGEDYWMVPVEILEDAWRLTALGDKYVLNSKEGPPRLEGTKIAEHYMQMDAREICKVVQRAVMCLC